MDPQDDAHVVSSAELEKLSAEIAKLQAENSKLKDDVAAWKTAWFHQRDVTGRVAWEFPPVRYIKAEFWATPEGQKVAQEVAEAFSRNGVCLHKTGNT